MRCNNQSKQTIEHVFKLSNPANLITTRASNDMRAMSLAVVDAADDDDDCDDGCDDVVDDDGVIGDADGVVPSSVMAESAQRNDKRKIRIKIIK